MTAPSLGPGSKLARRSRCASLVITGYILDPSLLAQTLPQSSKITVSNAT